MLPVHIGQERVEIPVSELPVIGLVEPNLQLLMEPLFVSQFWCAHVCIIIRWPEKVKAA